MLIYVQFLKSCHFPQCVITEILVLYDLHCFIQLFLEGFIDVYVHGEFGTHVHVYIVLPSFQLLHVFLCLLSCREKT